MIEQEPGSLRPLISVGVPVFNKAETITNTIVSVMEQSYDNIEIIVSDNGSTDGTTQVLERLERSEDRMQLFVQDQNIGAARNFNFVRDKAQGAYFMWLGGDDSLSPWFLERAMKNLEECEGAVGSGSFDCIVDNQGRKSAPRTFDAAGSTFEDRLIQFLTNAWTSNGLFYALYTEAVARKFEFTDPAYAGQDWSFIVEALRHGAVVREPQIGLYIGAHGESNTGNPWKTWRNRHIERIIPMWVFTRRTLRILTEENTHSWNIYIALIKINVSAVLSLLRLWIKNVLLGSEK